MPNLYATLRTDAEAAADQQRQQWPCDIKPRRPKHGLHDQGRYPEFADTYPTQPAELDQRPGLHLVDSSDHGAAHVCSSITSDSDRDEPMGEGAGVLLWPMAVIAACACWALFAFLTSSPL